MSGGPGRPPVAGSRGALAAAALIVLAAGCGTSGPATSRPASAPGGTAASKTARAAVSTPPPGQLKALGARYVTIAVPANRRLDHEVDGFADNQRDDLAAAEAALRAQAATERWFDRHLAEIPFPPGIAGMASALIRVNQSRAALADREAQATSLAGLRSFAAQHAAADAATEFGVRLIRQALDLPPPSTS